jgi:hypothetical protein
MKMKTLKKVLNLIIFFVSLKCVHNQSCLDWSDWKNYKADFNIQFYNSSLELIA